jgi:hypothetical protein
MLSGEALDLLFSFHSPRVFPFDSVVAMAYLNL